MDVLLEQNYGVNERLLRFVGLWPFQRQPLSHFIVTSIVLLAGSQLCCKIKVLVSSWPDMQVIIEATAPVIVDLICVVKLFNWVINRHKMELLLKEMRRSWKIMTSYELEILQSFTEDGKTFTIRWSCYIYSMVVTFLGLPLLPQILGKVTSMNVTGPKQLPTPVEYYHIDTQDYYYPILLHASYTAAIFCTVLVATDSMFVVFIQHACGLFASLGLILLMTFGRHRAEMILKDGDDDEDEYLDKRDDWQYMSFYEWIDRHNNAIEFSELIDSAHATSFVLIMALNMVIISFSGVQMLSNAATPHLLVRQSCMVIGQLFHLYVDNFYSQKLLDHSSSLHYTIWSTHWYRTSIRTKKLLALMKMRALEPCVCTAGGLYVMSMENFSWVLKTSTSYFTMLRSFQ